MRITRLADALGAEISGVDLTRLEDRDFAAIRAAWLEHLVRDAFDPAARRRLHRTQIRAAQ